MFVGDFYLLKSISVRFTRSPHTSKGYYIYRNSTRLEKDRENTKWNEKFEPPNFYKHKIGLEIYSPANTCYLSWKKNRDLEIRTMNHVELFPVPEF